MREAVIWFGGLTETADMVNNGIMWILAAIALIALADCFLGIRVYPAVVSGGLFCVTAAVFCLLWKEKQSWLYVAAGFCVVGAVLAFLGFRWKKTGAVLLCGAECAMLILVSGGHVFLAFLGGIAGAVFTYRYTDIGIMLFQSLCGALIFYDLAYLLLGKQSAYGILWYLGNIGLFAAGLCIQLLINKRTGGNKG